MAYLLETIRSQKQTSIHGRKLGLTYDGYLTGPKTLIHQVEDVSTTVASTLSAFGLSRILTSGSSQCSIYTLEAPPRPGVRKEIFLFSSSTGCQLVKASGGALFYGCSVSTIGSTVINLLGRGAHVSLQAATTIAWYLMGSLSSLVSSDHQNISFSTST